MDDSDKGQDPQNVSTMSKLLAENQHSGAGNENDETVTAISWAVTRFDILNPDNLLALSALDAYQKIAEKNGGLKDPSAIRTIIRIAEGNYIRPVQAQARAVLDELRKYSSQNSQKQ